MSPGARKFLSILGVCLVFVVGMAAGAAVTFRVVLNRAQFLLTERGGDLATERLARRLSDRLSCDATQREQIAAILQGAHGETREIRREVTPRLREIYARAMARVRGTLRPEQIVKLDAGRKERGGWLQASRLDGPASTPTASPNATATPTPSPSASPDR